MPTAAAAWSFFCRPWASCRAGKLKREALELDELMSQFEFGDRTARPAPAPARQDAQGLQKKLQAAVAVGKGQGDWLEF